MPPPAGQGRRIQLPHIGENIRLFPEKSLPLRHRRLRQTFLKKHQTGTQTADLHAQLTYQQLIVRILIQQMPEPVDDEDLPVQVLPHRLQPSRIAGHPGIGFSCQGQQPQFQIRLCYHEPVAAGQQLLHCRQHQFFTAGAVTELHIQ